ncbi:hypothetical protein BpHYR1_014279, partial [Brachionus plicatilis]
VYKTHSFTKISTLSHFFIEIWDPHWYGYDSAICRLSYYGAFIRLIHQRHSSENSRVAKSATIHISHKPSLNSKKSASRSLKKLDQISL